MTSNAGSVNKTDCANPSMNVVLAFVLLLSAAIGLMLYIIGGRLQRMAFVRKERLVSKSRIMSSLAIGQLLNAGVLCSEVAHLRRRGQLSTLAKVGVFLKMIWKWMVLVNFFLVVFVLFFVAAVLRIFFTSLILWRGYNIYVDVSYLNRITEYVDHLLKSIHLEQLTFLFYPFLYALNAVASISLNFSTVQVNCNGCQSTIQLFLDCVIVGVAVIIIQSDMEVYWGTVFAGVHSKFRSLLFQRSFWKSTSWNFRFLLWSILLEIVPHPRKILQYSIGLVRVVVFFEDHGHARSSANCDQVIPIGTTGADTLLAYFSTAFAYVAICPVVYLFAQVLVPQFKLQPGTVKAEGNILHQAKRQADKLFRCAKCDLGLHRQYTSHFG